MNNKRQQNLISTRQWALETAYRMLIEESGGKPTFDQIMTRARELSEFVFGEYPVSSPRFVSRFAKHLKALFCLSSKHMRQ